MTPGLRLVLVPLPLACAALAVYALCRRRSTLATGIGAVAVAVSLALLGSLAAVVGVGSVERSVGEIVPGIPLLLRADLSGTTIALLVLGIAGHVVLFGRQPPLAVSGLLLGAAGAVLCALGGSLVLIAAGLQTIQAGTLLVSLAATGRLQRRVVVVLGAQFLTSLGLVAAATVVLGTTGTVDLAALPAAAVSSGVAVLWIVAAATALAAPLLVTNLSRTALGWAAAMAVAGGFAVLLRLHDVVRLLTLPTGMRAFLIALGCTAAVIAASTALTAADAEVGGRRLCLVMSSMVLVLAGIGSDVAFASAALDVVALIVVLVAAPAWASVALPGPVAAVAVGSAGPLPWSPTMAPAVLSVGTIAASGLPTSLGALPIGLAMALAAGAAVRAGRCAWNEGWARANRGAPRVASSQGLPPRGRWPHGGSMRRQAVSLDEEARRPPGMATWATLAASVVVAILPGLVLGGVSSRIVAAPGIEAVGLAAVRGPGGGWAGGYLLVAAVLVAAVVASALVLAGVPAGVPERGEFLSDAAIEAERRAVSPPLPVMGSGGRPTGAASDAVEGKRPALPLGSPRGGTAVGACLAALVPGRLAHDPVVVLRRTEALLDRLDGWLAGQPTLTTALVAALVCIVVVR